MTSNLMVSTTTDIKVEKIKHLKESDLMGLCEATAQTVENDNMSFKVALKQNGNISKDRLESYWKGVLLVPERQLFVGRINGSIAAAIQLIKPSASDTTTSYMGKIEQHFVAPWARGHGLAKDLLKAVENEARTHGINVIKLSVRADLENANKLYKSCGYKKWGTFDRYEMIDGKLYAGNFYYKDLV